MKIMRRQLRKLVREALILELFDSDAYPFNFESHVIDEPDQDYVALTYNFTADGGNIYFVSINANGPDSAWDVMFRVVDGDYTDLTGQFDMRVYATVAEIVKDFVANRLPYLKNESMRRLRLFEISPMSGFEGDSRRGRVYQRMLKNYGIDAALVKDMTGGYLLQFELPAASLNEAAGSFGCNQHSLGFITDQGAWISLTDNGLEDKELHVDWLIKNDYVDDEGSAEMPDDWIKVNNAASLLVPNPKRLSQEHISGLVEMWLDCSKHLPWMLTGIEDKKVEVFGPPGSGPSMIFVDYTIPEMIERFDETGRLMDVFFNRLMESASPKKKNSIALTEAKLKKIEDIARIKELT